eukprot:4343986-Pyramimonas_sp.AAC.1
MPAALQDPSPKNQPRKLGIGAGHLTMLCRNLAGPAQGPGRHQSQNGCDARGYYEDGQNTSQKTGRTEMGLIMGSASLGGGS